MKSRKFDFTILLRKSEGGGPERPSEQLIYRNDPLGAPVATAQWLLIKGTP